MRLSIAVDRSTVPPVLRINGIPTPWQLVTTIWNRESVKSIRQTLRNMTGGQKLVAYTMKGAALPSQPYFTSSKQPKRPVQLNPNSQFSNE